MYNKVMIQLYNVHVKYYPIVLAITLVSKIGNYLLYQYLTLYHLIITYWTELNGERKKVKSQEATEWKRREKLAVCQLFLYFKNTDISLQEKCGVCMVVYFLSGSTVAKTHIVCSVGRVCKCI